MGWRFRNLTKDSGGAPRALGRPISHVVDDSGTDGTHHVFFASEFEASIQELWWSGDGPVQWDDLRYPSSEIGFLTDPTQTLASHVFHADGTQHVFCRGIGSHVFELRWRVGGPVEVNDLTAQSGEPVVLTTSLTSQAFEAEGTQHVFVTMLGQIGQGPVDRHVGEFCWRRGESARLEDLTVRSRAQTLADTALAGHVVEEAGSQHVFYVAGGDVIELSRCADRDWREHNLSRSARPGPAVPAASRPVSHFLGEDRTHHVFYTADDGRVIELSWRTGEDPRVRDLSGTSVGDGVAPPAVSAPASHVFETAGDLTQHVFYTADNGHIIELCWSPNDIARHDDLTVHSGGAPLAPTHAVFGASHSIAGESSQHVFYRTDDLEIVELWFAQQ